MKKIFFILFCSFFLLSCNTSKENVHFYVKKLIEGKRYESQIVGIGMPSHQWPHYLKFKELASKNQLIKYCHHQKGVIRAYAFLTLLEIDIRAAKKIFDAQRECKLSVPVMYGCVTFSPQPISEIYTQLIFNKWGPDVSCYPPDTLSEGAKTYFWFMQKP